MSVFFDLNRFLRPDRDCPEVEIIDIIEYTDYQAQKYAEYLITIPKENWSNSIRALFMDIIDVYERTGILYEDPLSEPYLREACTIAIGSIFDVLYKLNARILRQDFNDIASHTLLRDNDILAENNYLSSIIIDEPRGDAISTQLQRKKPDRNKCAERKIEKATERFLIEYNKMEKAITVMESMGLIIPLVRKRRYLPDSINTYSFTDFEVNGLDKVCQYHKAYIVHRLKQDLCGEGIPIWARWSEVFGFNLAKSYNDHKPFSDKDQNSLNSLCKKITEELNRVTPR